MKKSLWFWLSFVVAVLLAIYFATRIIMVSMGHGAPARIKSVSISSDISGKNLSALAPAVGIAPGTLTYQVNLDDINARISGVVDVRKSAVRRMPNGNLNIRVQLHRAVALWSDGTNFYPLSADGTIVRRPLDSRPENTVVFRGPLPADISQIAKLAHGMTEYLDYLEWIEDRRWNLHTHDNIIVMLPEEDPYSAISSLMILDKNHKILSKKISVLDMRDPARILVK